VLDFKGKGLSPNCSKKTLSEVNVPGLLKKVPLMGEFAETTHKALFELRVRRTGVSSIWFTKTKSFEQNGIADTFPRNSKEHPPLKNAVFSVEEQSGSQQQLGSQALRVKSQRQVLKSCSRFEILGVVLTLIQ
jgi:hypothetical protein